MNDNLYLSDSQLQAAIRATAETSELNELNELLRRTAAIRAARPESAEPRGALLLLGDKLGVYALTRTCDGDSEIVSLYTDELEAADLAELGNLSEGSPEIFVSTSYEPINDPSVTAAAVAEHQWGACNECGKRNGLVATIDLPGHPNDEPSYVCPDCVAEIEATQPQITVTDLTDEESNRIYNLISPAVRAELAREQS